MLLTIVTDGRVFHDHGSPGDWLPSMGVHSGPRDLVLSNNSVRIE